MLNRILVGACLIWFSAINFLILGSIHILGYFHTYEDILPVLIAEDVVAVLILLLGIDYLKHLKP